MNMFPSYPNGVEFHPNASLSEFTTFRLGGPCPTLLRCRTPDQVAAAREHLARSHASYELIGGGSNVLVSDRGLNIPIVSYCAGDGVEVHFDGPNFEVGAGVVLDDLIRACIDRGLGGLECLSGIPGTLGGAIAGNAGAFGKTMAEALESVTLMDQQGRQYDAAASDLAFVYRGSRLQQTGECVLWARLKLNRRKRADLLETRKRILKLRREKHPDWRVQPTAGCFFRNVEPLDNGGDRRAAAWFLERAGAKEMRVGGARVFERHANIIVAEPGCCAQDVADLARQMAESVRRRFGIVLVPEVRFMGLFNEATMDWLSSLSAG